MWIEVANLVPSLHRIDSSCLWRADANTGVAYNAVGCVGLDGLVGVCASIKTLTVRLFDLAGLVDT